MKQEMKGTKKNKIIIKKKEKSENSILHTVPVCQFFSLFAFWLYFTKHSSASSVDCTYTKENQNQTSKVD